MGFNQKPSGRSPNPSDRGGGPSPADRQPGAAVLYPLPPELAGLYRSASKDSLNPAVIFDRFAPDLSRAGNKKEDWKKQALQSAAVKADSNALGAYLSRWRALVQAAGAQPFTMQTDWRFIPGLGRKSALEIGFNFHRYGFPYLPGSAVKGIARTCALFELTETVQLPAEPPDLLNQLDQLLALPDEEFEKEIDRRPHWSKLKAHSDQTAQFRAVFGTLEQAGGAIFFEAIPAEPIEVEPGNKFALEIDIMNPHYKEYYRGNTAPVDWDSPNPVTFLAVPAGKTFHFAVGWRRGARQPELCAKAAGWLKQGLKDLGAGAKTAAGYGYFK